MLQQPMATANAPIRNRIMMMVALKFHVLLHYNSTATSAASRGVHLIGGSGFNRTTIATIVSIVSKLS